MTLDNVKKRPQAILDNAVANFIFENDGPHRSHLLILYYTGHGYATGSNELMLAGSVRLLTA